MFTYGKLLLCLLAPFILFSCHTKSGQTLQEPEKITASDCSEADILRGSIGEARAWWDLEYYHLKVAVDIADSSLSGTNLVRFEALKEGRTVQIDLQAPMRITSALSEGEELRIQSKGAAHFIELPEEVNAGKKGELLLHFEGRPRVAKNPPWDGGITWKRDKNGKPFIASSNQGIGSSIWWPNKDHPADEVDSMRISVTVPDDLMDVSNGRLEKVTDNEDGTQTFQWFVSTAINNYGININIADYVHFSDTYEGLDGELDLSYYVLPYNLEKAKEQFTEAKKLIEAMEHYFGPYPFYRDGYKLVEAPYLGMEHQSSVTYGNGYQKGYMGNDLSGSGWGMKFDFIIIHESAHEWWANSITNSDVADMWIHEGFTQYCESLYLEYFFGKRGAAQYVIGLRNNIRNDVPIIGKYGCNRSGSGDMYAKGANLLHTIRAIVGDDALWWECLKGLYQEFHHSIVTSAEIEEFIATKTGKNLDAVFGQYLRDTRVPLLEYKLSGKKLQYRWQDVVSGFEMPVDILLNGENPLRIEPVQEWQSLSLDEFTGSIEIDPDFYVFAQEVSED